MECRDINLFYLWRAVTSLFDSRRQVVPTLYTCPARPNPHAYRYFAASCR